MAYCRWPKTQTLSSQSAHFLARERGPGRFGAFWAPMDKAAEGRPGRCPPRIQSPGAARHSQGCCEPLAGRAGGVEQRCSARRRERLRGPPTMLFYAWEGPLREGRGENGLYHRPPRPQETPPCGGRAKCPATGRGAGLQQGEMTEGGGVAPSSLPCATSSLRGEGA